MQNNVMYLDVGWFCGSALSSLGPASAWTTCSCVEATEANNC